MSAATAKENAMLATVYSAIAEWLLYPREVDPDTLKDDHFKGVLAAAAEIGPDVALGLKHFKDKWGTITEEQYLNLLELNPRCPLYLGSHQFEEPTSCGSAGLSDRNTYMLEIGNIYRHFGFSIKGELPDYLPAMVEFMALTAECDDVDFDVRMRLAVLLMAEGVALVAEKLAKEPGPYGHLLSALESCLEQEIAAYPGSAELRAAASKPEGQQKQLIQIEGAAV